MIESHVIRIVTPSGQQYYFAAPQRREVMMHFVTSVNKAYEFSNNYVGALHTRDTMERIFKARGWRYDSIAVLCVSF